MKTNPHIQKAVDIFGSQVSLARKLGCNPTFIHQLLHGVKTPSPKMALAIESATEKKVSRKVLRPSDWFDIWPEIAHKDDAMKRHAHELARNNARSIADFLIKKGQP